MYIEIRFKDEPLFSKDPLIEALGIILIILISILLSAGIFAGMEKLIEHRDGRGVESLQEQAETVKVKEQIDTSIIQEGGLDNAGR